VSDAGTPLLNDPGFPLVREAVAKGVRVESIPGPSALLAALAASGFPCEPFVFCGFLPAKEKARRDLLLELKTIGGSTAFRAPTLVFYESCYRIAKSMRDIAEIMSERRVAVARELTKKFEEFIRGRADEVLRHLDGKKAKGEFVIIVNGRDGDG
jgi:16S rRNA (cytidine1402-2'-O)-methyltransferase